MTDFIIYICTTIILQVFGKFLACETLHLVEGDPSKIDRKQQLNRCRILEHGALAERWKFLLSMVTSLPAGMGLKKWEALKEDIRRRISSKFFSLYCIDLGKRLNEENRDKHAHKEGDGGLRGPLRATQICKEKNNENKRIGKKKGRKTKKRRKEKK